MNCLVSCEYNENSVILDRVLANKSAEWEVVIDFDFFFFFFHEARILPSAVDRTCSAEIVLLMTVSAYKWKPSACEVCFSLNIGESVGKKCLHGNSLWILQAEKTYNKRHSQQK